MSFVAENGYLEIVAALEDLLNAGHARHSIADHDQPFHARTPANALAKTVEQDFLCVLCVFA